MVQPLFRRRDQGGRVSFLGRSALQTGPVIRQSIEDCLPNRGRRGEALEAAERQEGF